MGLENFIQKVRKAETPFYAGLNRFGKSVMRMDVPYIPVWHDFWYREQQLRINLWRNFWRAFYHQPLFRSRCTECGRNLFIYHSGQGLPWIEGKIDIRIGDNVRFYDRSAIAGLTVGRDPTLTIGDNTDVGAPISIFVGDEVSIGSNCLIGCQLIADNPGHRRNYKERISERVEVERIGKVIINDYVYTGQYSLIVGNVTVGTGSIIAARAVVTKDVPPFCIAAGNPARIVKKMPFPDEMIEVVGEEQYRMYMEADV